MKWNELNMWWKTEWWKTCLFKHVPVNATDGTIRHTNQDVTNPPYSNQCVSHRVTLKSVNYVPTCLQQSMIAGQKEHENELWLNLSGILERGHVRYLVRRCDYNRKLDFHSMSPLMDCTFSPASFFSICHTLLTESKMLSKEELVCETHYDLKTDVRKCKPASKLLDIWFNACLCGFMTRAKIKSYFPVLFFFLL